MCKTSKCPDSQSCLSPALKLAPSAVTSASKVNFRCRLDPGPTLSRMTFSNALSSASSRNSLGSMLSLRQTLAISGIALARCLGVPTGLCLQTGMRLAERWQCAISTESVSMWRHGAMVTRTDILFPSQARESIGRPPRSHRHRSRPS